MPNCRISRIVSWTCLGVALVSVIPGCGPSTTRERSKYSVSVDPESIPPGSVVKIDGSSSLYPVTEAVAEEFQHAMHGTVQPTVGFKGTGGGMNRFCEGEIDICNASRPITADEIRRASDNGIEFIELPVCFDALTVAIHPDNDWAETITVEELKKIWEPSARGNVTKWSDVRPGWPDEDLMLFGAGSASGTFDYFTEAIVGKAKSSRGDFTASEDDNVLVQGIEGNRYALGYIPFAYYEINQERLKSVGIDAQNGNGPVKPSIEAVLDGKYTPLSRPLLIYVNKKSAERPEVRAFVDFYLTHAKDLASEVFYPPLPENAYALAKKRFEQRQGGSIFSDGPAVGVSVEDLLSKQSSSSDEGTKDADASDAKAKDADSSAAETGASDKSE